MFIYPLSFRPSYDRSAYPDACVVWVDAHADLNTVETTESGTSLQFPLVSTI